VREERIERREDMVADDVAKLEMPGRNGGGVESPEARRYDDVREVVREEREPIMGGKGGVESPEARRYDEVREERIERREDMVADDVAKLEMPGRNGAGTEPRRDYEPTGGERDARAEMRETDPGMLGATK